MAETNYKKYAKHLIECYLERKDEKRVWNDAKSMFANEEEKDQMQIETEIRLTHRNEFDLFRELSRTKKRSRSDDDAEVRTIKRVNLQFELFSPNKLLLSS